jgi:hypothetical protein
MDEAIRSLQFVVYGYCVITAHSTIFTDGLQNATTDEELFDSVTYSSSKSSAGPDVVVGSVDSICSLETGNLLLISICNFHVLSRLLLIYIRKLHWNLNTMFVCQVGKFLLIFICNFHVLWSRLLLIYICKLYWNLNTMFVCQVNYFWFSYVISMS